MLGKVNYEDDDKTFEDFVASCAITTSHEITRLAAKRIGVETNYMPGFDIAKEAPYIVGFSVCIVYLINEFLVGDDVTIDLKGTIIDVAKLHYMLLDNHEASELALKGIEVFQDVQANKSKTVNDWRDGLSKLISIYVLQWTSENTEFKKLECIPLFGKHLTILINVGLHGSATA